MPGGGGTEPVGLAQQLVGDGHIYLPAGELSHVLSGSQGQLVAAGPQSSVSWAPMSTPQVQDLRHVQAGATQPMRQIPTLRSQASQEETDDCWGPEWHTHWPAPAGPITIRGPAPGALRHRYKPVSHFPRQGCNGAGELRQAAGRSELHAAHSIPPQVPEPGCQDGRGGCWPLPTPGPQPQPPIQRVQTPA